MVMGSLMDNKMGPHDFDPSLVRHDRFQFFILFCHYHIALFGSFIGLAFLTVNL